MIDYINRFWILDVDARIQLFDLKNKYQFQTQPGVDQYNMPLYNVQTEAGSQNINMYPVYQGFMDPCYINGIQVPFNTDKTTFFNIWPNIVQQLFVVATGDGGPGPYPISFPITPSNSTPINPPVQAIFRGHVDITGIVATGVNQDPPFGSTINPLIPSTSIFPAVYLTSNDANGNQVIVQDSGQFLNYMGTTYANLGLLMSPGTAPFGYAPLPGGYSPVLNTINYLDGTATVTFPVDIPEGVYISAQCFYFQCGLPRGVLYNNNTITLRSCPDTQYLVELDAYLSPAAFLTSSAALQFGYMSEYIARGAARKILSDTGDTDQFMFYEPLFREQEILVWKRSQRQFSASRTQTIYSQGINQGQSGFNNLGGSTLALLWGMFGIGLYTLTCIGSQSMI